MPIYEYRCEGCGHELEVMQKFSDAALVDCPACGKAALKKRVSAAGFQLKGSGWYATDSKKGGKKTESSDSSSEGKSKTKSGGGCCGGGACGSR
ncbi:MAG: transcriptional regulator [Candidatus Muproteobacteria bacterium RIFCSPHIGHO2_01_FULL_65_16]|uniref:Transcriptional regulator n=2 Tax=Candidatus Muproteobacteria TaxID=1817795 RepID=A0A1F6TRN9_9PROT|nr:MAG: transcriptional regulator [Candidatus Muproteobacteria bacterium RIFCSPHIGHO2_01_FULL_65_16]